MYGGLGHRAAAGDHLPLPPPPSHYHPGDHHLLAFTTPPRASSPTPTFPHCWAATGPSVPKTPHLPSTVEPANHHHLPLPATKTIDCGERGLAPPATRHHATRAWRNLHTAPAHTAPDRLAISHCWRPLMPFLHPSRPRAPFDATVEPTFLTCRPLPYTFHCRANYLLPFCRAFWHTIPRWPISSCGLL